MSYQMLTSHMVNSCKKVLYDYGEFTKSVDHVLTDMQEEINEESDKAEQKDKEAYENIKTIRSELESVHKELKTSISARNREKVVEHFTITLNLLEKLQQELKKAVAEGPDEFLINLEINYFRSTIERIVSKANSK